MSIDNGKSRSLCADARRTITLYNQTQRDHMRLKSVCRVPAPRPRRPVGSELVPLSKIGTRWLASEMLVPISR